MWTESNYSVKPSEHVSHTLNTCPSLCVLQRDPEMETQALDWIEAITGEKLDRSKDYPDMIKDGIVLCR